MLSLHPETASFRMAPRPGPQPQDQPVSPGVGPQGEAERCSAGRVHAVRDA
jgi:hypothetical protein